MNEKSNSILLHFKMEKSRPVCNMDISLYNDIENIKRIKNEINIADAKIYEAFKILEDLSKENNIILDIR